MKTFKFKKIDAFATTYSKGNPAGYIKLESKDEITPNEMLQIAKELKGFVNEVGYLCKINRNEFDFKYYSSEREVDFCGHATIAIMYDLIKNDPDLFKTNLLTIRTNKGNLNVENRLAKEDAVFIMSPAPEENDNIPTINALADSLNIERGIIENEFPVKLIDAGLRTLIVPIKSLNDIITISPDINVLGDFCRNNSIDIIEVFTNSVSDKKNDFRVRVFAPTSGYLEDPATGSGNSAFGYYLIKNRMWINETVTIEQNGFLDKFNIVKLQKTKDDNGADRVLFGGGAITRIEGEYMIY
jgi:PhzF family phenazine biosynthesis protein